MKESNGAKKLRDCYAIRPGAPFYVTEFGNGYYFGLDRWKQEGMPQDVPKEKLFGFDDFGQFWLSGLIGDRIMFPAYEPEEIYRDENYHVTKDAMGREVKEFNASDLVYMPEYVGYAVKDEKTWFEDVKPRLNADSPERYAMVEEISAKAKAAAEEGKIVTYEVDGGFMYLRDLFGPENLLISFFDSPELIHEAMQCWFEIHDRLTAEYQKHIDIEELFLKEDVCYKTSSLVSPQMLEEFLFPYYTKLIENMKSRNKRVQKMFIGIDSDGHIESVIPAYRKIGVTIFSPFEVAADCDVVEIGKKYPDIVMYGGFDKRILATTKEKIKAEADRIFPAMKARGGYYPTCDHGVPEDVPYENYLYFRQLIDEYGK